VLCARVAPRSLVELVDAVLSLSKQTPLRLSK